MMYLCMYLCMYVSVCMYACNVGNAGNVGNYADVPSQEENLLEANSDFGCTKLLCHSLI